MFQCLNYEYFLGNTAFSDEATFLSRRHSKGWSPENQQWKMETHIQFPQKVKRLDRYYR